MKTEISALRYLDILQSHASDFSSHLSGALSGRERLEPSFFPPAGFWTVGEKDAFFHSLAVHSRFRPDLIAADIPGKSLADVCSYLDILTKATSSSPKLKQTLSKPAHESTPEWMEAEESHAILLVTRESQWDSEDRTRRRTRRLEDDRKAMSHPNGSRQAPRIYREEQKRVEGEMKDVRAQRKLEWDREDFTMALDTQKLKTMDYIALKSEVMRRRTAASTNETNAARLFREKQPSQTIEDDLEGALVGVEISDLSPASRRRHAKRMYMRRKRAEKTGQPISASFERPKHFQNHPPSQGQDTPLAMPRPQSVTLLKQFAAVGIDSAFFESTKLEVFNFQTLGELMKLYNSTRDWTDSEPTISLSTLELMHAELLCFLTDVILKCISLHEQESSMKDNSDVWKLKNDKIKATTVQEALAIMSFESDRQSYFSNFEARMDSFMVDEKLRTADDEDIMEDSDPPDAIGKKHEASGDDEEEEVDSDYLEEMNHEPLSLSPSGIHLPFLWHSSLDHVQPGRNVEDDGDADMLIASDDDEEEYHQVLLSDEKVDEADIIADREAQTRMWEALAGKSQNEEDADAKTSKRGFPGLRLLEPDTALGIKSNVYIDDSD